MPAEIMRRSQVNAPTTQKLRKFGLHSDNTQQTRRLAWFELHQKIHIIIRPFCPFQDRTEERQALNVMLLAERGQRGTISEQIIRHYNLVAENVRSSRGGA